MFDDQRAALNRPRARCVLRAGDGRCGGQFGVLRLGEHPPELGLANSTIAVTKVLGLPVASALPRTCNGRSIAFNEIPLFGRLVGSIAAVMTAVTAAMAAASAGVGAGLSQT